MIDLTEVLRKGSEVSPGQQLWRYMDFCKYTDLLLTSALRLTRLDQFRDPNEGQLRKDDFNAWMKDYLDQLEAMGVIEDREKAEDSFRELAQSGHIGPRQTVFVSSWFAQDHEDANMWEAYCADGKGLAVISSVERIAASAESHNAEFLEADLVAYLDMERESVYQLGRDIAFCKGRAFAGEKEFRLSAWLPWDVEKSTSETIVLGANAVSINVSLPDLVESVCIAPAAREWQAKTMVDLTRRLGFDWPIAQSQLFADPR